MELRHLRCLVTLADERQFTRAAQRLGIAQPALSQQIRRLEAEMGLPLVDRTTRSVQLTAAGLRLVGHARRMLHEAELAVAELQDLRGLKAGRLAVGASHTIGALDLSRLLAEFHRRFPDVELRVQDDVSLELAAALNRGELDLAFMTMAGESHALESHLVSREPLTCIVPPAHPLAERSSLRMSDVAGETFVVFRRGATIRRRVDEAAEAAGFSPRVLFETNSVGRMGSLVATGLGIAVLPASDAARFASSVVVVPFAGPALAHTVYVSWSAQRRQSPAARAFTALVFEVAGELEG
jgi:LysR family transcriptional activator of glutamate synthase operon